MTDELHEEIARLQERLRDAEAERERAELEQRVQQARKLESLGLLAGGIAHDFNNLLMGVLGNVGLARQNLEPGSAAAPHLVQIETAARRAAELTDQLLAYSGRGRREVRPLDVGELVREMADLLQTVIAEEAELRLELPARGPHTVGDAVQLRQVVMNLSTNASDALGGGAGTIAVRAGESEPGRAELDEMLLGSACEPGPMAWIEVADDGAGMDPATVEQIFDPFFSTKVTGRGLGLAAVLGIVRSHRGALRVETAPGAGTTIRVVLPHAPPGRLEREPPPAERSTARDGGLVLVIDDEEIVRETVELILGESGYEPLCAAGGAEALRLFAERADEVRVVLLDMTMPGMGGEETLAQLRAVRAGVPVILTSGYDPEETAARVGQRCEGFIQKPYTPDQLVALIRRVLHE